MTAATSERLGDHESLFIQISPVIEREFVRRNVFPELRAALVLRFINGATGQHRVSIERAREIVADARAQLATRGDLPRGLPVAYSCLARNVEEAIRREERRGLLEDPGMIEIRKQVATSFARFGVGEQALYFHDGDGYGERVVIVEGPTLFRVRSDSGPFFIKDGVRIDYRYGYLVTRQSEQEQSFAPPHRLTRDDCKPSHLQLAVTNGVVR